MAAVQAAVATAANHLAALDDGSQEIYFTCMPYNMCFQIEISPSTWAETLPLFSVIEVRKRSRRKHQPSTTINAIVYILVFFAIYVFAIYVYIQYS